MVKTDITIPWLNDYKASVEIIQGNRLIHHSESEDHPMCSIIVANYNRAGNLPKIIESVEKQQYQGDIELIFVDDRSNDDSIEILQQFPNINIYRLSKNFGSEALPQNVGMYFAKGEFVSFIDSDDYLLVSDAISSMIFELSRKQEAVLAVSNVIFQIENKDVSDEMRWVLPGVEFAEVFDPRQTENLIKIHYPEKAYSFSRRLARNWNIFDVMVRGYHIGLRMAKKRQLQELGGWPLELKQNDDYGMLLNIASYGYKNKIQSIIPVNSNAYVYRINNGNASVNEKEETQVMRDHCLNAVKYLGFTFEELTIYSKVQNSEGKESVLDRWNFTKEELLYEK